MIVPADAIAVDYSYSRFPAAALVRAGVALVVRYVSPRRNHPKNITSAERDELLGAGLALLLVWENAAQDAIKGSTVGALHGASASAFAHDLGYPTHLPLIAAVDTDTSYVALTDQSRSLSATVPRRSASHVPAMLDYLNAFREASSYPLGVYGNDIIVTAAHDHAGSVFGWQTRAWSKGRRSPHADCLQQIGFVHPSIAALFTFGSIDDNTVLRPFEAWSTATPTPPTPIPPTPTPEEDEMDPRRFVRNSAGEIFLIDVDWQGKPWGDTVANLGIDWRLYNPPSVDLVPDDALAALPRRPTPLPASNGGLGEDHHHELTEGKTGGARSA